LALVDVQVAIERNNLVEVVRITEIVLTVDVVVGARAFPIFGGRRIRIIGMPICE